MQPAGDRIRTKMRAIHRYIFHPHRLYAASVLRVSLGFLGLVFFLSHFHQREFLWGVHGQLDWAFWTHLHSGQIIADGLYTWYGAHWWTETLYWCGVATSALYMVGIYPRLMLIPFMACIVSAYQRNPIMLDGGHNIMQLVLLYLVLVDTGHYWSLCRFRLAGKARRFFIVNVQPFVNALHNFGMMAILLQVAMLYFWACFYKITSHKWQDGTALYYILRVHEFSLPGLSEHVYQNALIVTALAYSTIVFQSLFPALMWFRRTKVMMFCLAICFHIGIAVLMGLTIFSLTMVLIDFSILSDETIHAIGRGARMAVSVVRSASLQLLRRSLQRSAGPS